jgi:hypothetical protein
MISRPFSQTCVQLLVWKVLQTQSMPAFVIVVVVWWLYSFNRTCVITSYELMNGLLTLLKIATEQCTLNQDFPRQSKSLDSSGSTRTISISRMADFFAAFFHQLITSDNQNISNDSCNY